MSRCERCQTQLPPQDGTEAADWNYLCDECLYPGSDDPDFECDHEDFEEDILRGRYRCILCQHEWTVL